MFKLFRMRRPFSTTHWTPRALQVFATAKALAAPHPITAETLLLALENSDSGASKVLNELGIVPSALLQRKPPDNLAPACELYMDDFEGPLGAELQRLALNEGKALNHSYLGTETLLLVLAKLSVVRVELPYAKILHCFLSPESKG